MVHDKFNDAFDDFTRSLIRRKVRQLTSRAGFKYQDRADLEQELMLRVLQSLPSFDPAKAHRNKYFTAVIERLVVNILRDRQAEKRDWRRTRAGSDPSGASDEVHSLLECISQQDADLRHFRVSRTEQDLVDLVNDVATTIETLPDELRDLALRLKSQTVSDVAREMGIPRTTLYEQIRCLRRRFERAGLREYL